MRAGHDSRSRLWQLCSFSSLQYSLTMPHWLVNNCWWMLMTVDDNSYCPHVVSLQWPRYAAFDVSRDMKRLSWLGCAVGFMLMGITMAIHSIFQWHFGFGAVFGQIWSQSSGHAKGVCIAWSHGATHVLVSHVCMYCITPWLYIYVIV